MRAWIGTYTGTPSTGGVRFRMTFEGEGAEWQNVTILECAAPHRFLADVGAGPTGSPRLLPPPRGRRHDHAHLRAAAPEPRGRRDVGPGWDYYLDRLMAAARARRTMPEWESTTRPRRHYRGLHVPAPAAVPKLPKGGRRRAPEARIRGDPHP